MFQIETTDEFDKWLAGLDKRVRIRLVSRLAKLARGLWGDSKSVGGGDKSTQSKDIERAIELAKLAKEST